MQDWRVFPAVVGGYFYEALRSERRLAQFGYLTKSYADAAYGSVQERVAQWKTESHYSASGTETIYTWNFTNDVDASRSNPTTVGVTDPKGQTQYSFYYSTNSWYWSYGLLQRAQRKTTGGQVRRTQDLTWTQDGPAQILKLNPRVTSRTTTLDNGLSTRADLEYVADNSTNVRRVSEYGFDAGLLLRTVTGYWREAYPAYATLNLTDLPSSVSVRDPAGAEVSRVEYFYDEYALTGYGGNITNHDPAYGTSFTSRGNASRVRRYYQEGGRYVGTTMSYDIVGNMVSTTDARGNTTATTYSWSYAFPYRVTNALGHVTEYTWSQEPVYDGDILAGYGPALLTALKDLNEKMSAGYRVPVFSGASYAVVLAIT